MMSSPTTYYEWSQLIDRLSTGEEDEEVLGLMRSGSLEWSKGVSSRFVRMLTDTVDDRMNAALDKLKAMINNGDPNGLLEGISATRRELSFLKDVVSIDAIPNDTRSVLVDHVVDFSKQIQSSLESSAKADKTGKLMSVLSNNPLTISASSDEAVQ